MVSSLASPLRKQASYSIRVYWALPWSGWRSKRARTNNHIRPESSDHFDDLQFLFPVALVDETIGSRYSPGQQPMMRAAASASCCRISAVPRVPGLTEGQISDAHRATGLHFSITGTATEFHIIGMEAKRPRMSKFHEAKGSFSKLRDMRDQQRLILTILCSYCHMLHVSPRFNEFPSKQMKSADHILLCMVMLFASSCVFLASARHTAYSLMMN